MRRYWLILPSVVRLVTRRGSRRDAQHQVAPVGRRRVRCRHRWYDDRELGLGDRFETEVLAAVGESADTPQAWPVWPDWDREPVVRSKGVSSPPYRVVYFVEGDLLMIVAVAHSKRRPGYWKGRISL
jgi:toxin ParE1/3/4